MRLMLLTACLFAAMTVMHGCSRPKDFSGFLVERVVKYGGRTNAYAQLPKLEACWTIKSDKNGFQVSVKGASFKDVDTLIQQTFGAPMRSITNSNTGHLHSLWKAADIGVGIHLIERSDGVDISCLRAMTMTEMFQEMDKPWWKKIW